VEIASQISSKLSITKISAEVCIHHLYFSDKDYAKKGNLIKWNPAVKTEKDRDVLWEALLDGRIDLITSNHAPHTLEEKNQKYIKESFVKYAVVAMFQMYYQGKISIEKIIEKMA
jgi:dihydroorotase